MTKDKILRILSFAFIIVILCSLSYSARCLLVDKFNGCDFKLVSIDHINNYGAAFSILQHQTPVLITVSLLILIIALFFIFKNIEKFKKHEIFLTSMLCSGIICNLVERIMDGYVTDYIRLTFITFPIFNTSDVFICIGAFMLICNILFNDEQPN